MNTYNYVNANGHPYLFNTTGVCSNEDSMLINEYLSQTDKDSDLGNRMVVYNTVVREFSKENNTAFRVKIKNLKN